MRKKHSELLLRNLRRKQRRGCLLLEAMRQEKLRTLKLGAFPACRASKESVGTGAH